MKPMYKKIISFTISAACFGQAAMAQISADTVVLRKSTVQIGFAEQPARYVTSAISTIKGEALQKSFNTNIGNALYGQLAGLTVSQNNNEPGINSPGLAIRGVSTYGPGSGLLIIIDGFLGDYTQLIPDEIEEISILKDASATAIYGNRAANGVLLVTTKRGKVSPLQVSFSSRQGFSQADGLPKFVNSGQYATLYNEALANDSRAPLYTQADIDAYNNGSNPFFRPNVNWYNEVLRSSAPVADYNLNFRGGNDNARYFVLLSNISSQGLYKNFGNINNESADSRYSRFNFRANIDVSISKRMTATLLLGGTVEDKTNPSSLYSGGTFAQLAQLPPNAFPVYNPNGTFGGSSNFSNPVANLLSTGSATSNGRTLQSSFRLTHDLDMITTGLSASVAVSINNYFISGSNKTKAIERFAITQGTLGDTVYTKFGQTTSLAGSEPNLSQYRNSTIQAFLNYHRVFGRHDFTALSMFNTDNSNINKSNIYSQTDNANLSLAYKNNGGATRVTYVNSEKYIGEVTVAYMASENYAKGNRLGYFPAVSAGWIASNENFLKKNSTVTFLKLRASYGLVGNNDIGGQRFMFDQRYSYGQSYNFGTGNTSVASLSEGRLANPNATWEKEKQANIGIEASFFNRLSVTLDVFNNDRYDILAPANATLPAFLGYTDLPSVNQGKVNNRGFEAVVKYSNSETKKLHFFVEAMVSYNKNRIDFNAQPIQVNPALINKGNVIGQSYGLVALGLFQNQAEIDASAQPIGVTLRPGDIRYQDIGGPLGVPDGIIDGNDAQPIGYTNLPRYTAGLHTGLQFGGFDLDLIFQGVTNNTVYLGSTQFRPFQNFAQAGEIALERWTPQNTSAIFPRLSADNNLNNYRFSSFYQRNGSFIKLRSAELGYTLPVKLSGRIKVQHFRFFATGTNLFSIDHIKYGIPDALGTGYPNLRTLTLGARIQF